MRKEYYRRTEPKCNWGELLANVDKSTDRFVQKLVTEALDPRADYLLRRRSEAPTKDITSPVIAGLTIRLAPCSRVIPPARAPKIR